jgi:hypothetical protein
MLRNAADCQAFPLLAAVYAASRADHLQTRRNLCGRTFSGATEMSLPACKLASMTAGKLSCQQAGLQAGWHVVRHAWRPAVMLSARLAFLPACQSASM